MTSAISLLFFTDTPCIIEIRSFYMSLTFKEKLSLDILSVNWWNINKLLFYIIQAAVIIIEQYTAQY